ncbi:substrate-binding periplasmic protein [Janthinobacterium sp. RB2P8]|uniref:substrate-binding periplasmic protein n=1 Tax=Janthinobacterium sp. RB2P8 TaxID=3424191 RepID=UPI003F259F13
MYRDAQGKYTGLDLELLKAIFKEARCTLVTLPELPTARRQLLFQKGELDLLPAASDTSERHAYARFSMSYRDETVGIFGKAGTPAVHLMLSARTTGAADRARLNAANTHLEQRGVLAAIRNRHEAP